MNRIVLTLTFIFAAWFAHGQAYDAMRRSTNAVGTDLIGVQTNSAGLPGQKFFTTMTLDNFLRTLAGLDEWDDLAGGSGGVSNGDKGDITVSGGGGVWRVNTHVTNGMNTRITALEAAGPISSNALQTQVTAITNGLNSGNTFYVRTNGNNGTSAKGRPDRPGRTLAYALTQVAIGDLIDLGAGVFDEGTSILDIPHGVHLVGSGRKSTVIYSSNGDTAPTMTPGSGSLIKGFTINNRNGATNVYHQPFGTVGPTQGQKLFTNAVVEDVDFVGDAVAVYIETQIGEPTSVTFRNCGFIADHDGAFLLGPYSNLRVENCYVYLNQANATNLVATSSLGRTGRGFLVGEGATVEIVNTPIFMTNHVTAIGLYVNEINGGSESRTQYVYMASSPMFLAATNGGSSYPYQFDGWGTNAAAQYQNVNPFPQSTALAIFTNYPGPIITTMTATGNRTNWLPSIAKGGWNRFPNLIQGVRDGAGTAGTAPITVRPQAGQTIDGAASYSLNENHGEVYFRADPSGTNWVSHSVNGALLAGKQDGSTTLGAISAIGNIGFIAVTGVGTAAARELTVDSGLSIANSEGDSGNPLISLNLSGSINGGTPNGGGAHVHWSELTGVPAGFADGTDDGGGGGGISTVKTNAANVATSATSLILSNGYDTASPIVPRGSSNSATATIQFGIPDTSGTGHIPRTNGPTLNNVTLLGSTVGGTANFTDGSFGTFSTTDLLVEGPATVEGPLRAESHIWTPGNITNSVLYTSNGVALLEKPLTQSGTNLVADGTLSGSFSNNITANIGGLTNILFINMVDGVTYDLWLTINPGVTVQFPQLSSGTNWTGGRIPSFETNTTPVLVKATRRGVNTNATVFQRELTLVPGTALSFGTTNGVTGSVTLNATRVGVYRTIYVDAAAMISNTTAGATFSTTESASPTNRMIDSYVFSGSASNIVQFKLAMPLEWDLGTVKVKLWTTGTNNVATRTNIWGIAASAIKSTTVNSNLNWGTELEITNVVSSAGGQVLLTPATPALTVGNSPASGGQIVSFRIMRKPLDADDNDDGQQQLLGAWIQYLETSTEVATW